MKTAEFRLRSTQNLESRIPLEMIILDTNALSDFTDGNRAILSVIPSDRPWALPIVVVGEYRFGLLGSNQRAIWEPWFEELLEVVEILNIDDDTTKRYAEVRLELARDNLRLPLNDAWIAALARQHCLPILSRDRHFDRVAGIRRVSW